MARRHLLPGQACRNSKTCTSFERWQFGWIGLRRHPGIPGPHRHFFLKLQEALTHAGGHGLLVLPATATSREELLSREKEAGAWPKED